MTIPVRGWLKATNHNKLQQITTSFNDYPSSGLIESFDLWTDHIFLPVSMTIPVRGWLKGLITSSDKEILERFNDYPSSGLIERPKSTPW